MMCGSIICLDDFLLLEKYNFLIFMRFTWFLYQNKSASKTPNFVMILKSKLSFPHEDMDDYRLLFCASARIFLTIAY